MSEWLRERTLALIEAYRRKECLWKSTNIDYTNRPVKSAAWEEVARAANCDVMTAEKKMKSLRTQFMFLYKEGLRNGCVRDGTIQNIKWFAFNALKFLVLDRHSNTRINSAGGRKRPYVGERSLGEDRYVGHSVEESNISNLQSHQEVFMAPTCSNRSHDVQNRTSINPMLENQNGDQIIGSSHEICSVVNVEPRQSERDEFVVFAEHVAHRLRKITDPHARLVAQHQINNILFEAEMATFKSPVSHSDVATNTQSVHESHVSNVSRNSSYYDNLETSGNQSNIIIIDEECDVKHFV